MAWSTLANLASGQIISKSWLDTVAQNINHLATRPRHVIGGLGTAQTAAAGGAYTQATAPAASITPGVTGGVLIMGIISLTHSVASGALAIRADINGVKVTGYAYAAPSSAGQAQAYHYFGVASVTAGVAYTVRFEFANIQGSGTVTMINTGNNLLNVMEIG